MPPGLTPKTGRNIHAMIHRALVDALAWKYMRDNTASHVKPPKRLRTRRQVWSTDDIQKFLSTVQSDRFAAASRGATLNSWVSLSGLANQRIALR